MFDRVRNPKVSVPAVTVGNNLGKSVIKPTIIDSLVAKPTKQEFLGSGCSQTSGSLEKPAVDDRYCGSTPCKSTERHGEPDGLLAGTPARCDTAPGVSDVDQVNGGRNRRPVSRDPDLGFWSHGSISFYRLRFAKLRRC